MSYGQRYFQTKIRERDGIKYQETEVHCDSEFCESRRYDEPSNSNQSNTYNNMDSDDSGFVPVDDFDDELPSKEFKESRKAKASCFI